MCGIVGFLGKNAVKTSVEKLKLLEYRGYDSAGVAFVKNGNIVCKKAVGRIVNLEQKIGEESEVAIAHTRWATHGKVNETNAHPHLHGEEWAIVHNGIIENYKAIKGNEPFMSETDSESIVFLLEKYGKGLKSVTQTINEISGSFAFLALCKDGSLYAVKNKSPLFLAMKNGEVMIASDPSCFCGFACFYYAFCDGQIGEIKDGRVNFFNSKGEKIKLKRNKLKIQKQHEECEKKESNMRKEIYQTPYVLESIDKIYNGEFLSKQVRSFAKYEKIFFIGCGTAYHACLYGALVFNKHTRFDARALVAGEMRYGDDKVDSKSICFFVSQSGETADTLGCVQKAKEKGAFTVALTNVGYSTLANVCEVVLPTLAGIERAVASTKAYVAQTIILKKLAYAFLGVKVYEEIENEDVERLESEAITFAKVLQNEKSMFLLGRKTDYVTAKESALKIKEVSYINANAYEASELKHGFIALIETGSVVITYATEPQLLTKSISSAQEAKARGAYCVLITSLDCENEDDFDKVVRVKSQTEAVIFSQLLSLHLAQNLGKNVDMPKNLAKSVTVE